MDPLIQSIGIRCRAAIIKIETQSDRVRYRYRGKPMTDADKREACEVRAFRLGQQFKAYNHDPFIEWDHPLSQTLSKSFLLGAGKRDSSAA